jgi:hypothetical protein
MMKFCYIWYDPCASMITKLGKVQEVVCMLTNAFYSNTLAVIILKYMAVYCVSCSKFIRADVCIC